MNKKHLAMLLALALIISIVPISAMAASEVCTKNIFGTHSTTTGEYVAPTATTAGYQTYVCEWCGEELSRVTFPATCKHDNLDADYTAPTCVKDGKTEYTCKDCGELVKTDVWEATGEHDWRIAVEHPATATEDGYNEYYCLTCGEEKTETVPATGEHVHDYFLCVVHPATATEAGYKQYNCKGCDDFYTEEIPALGETETCKHDSWDAVYTAPTCGRDGKTEYYCKACGELVKTDVWEATLDHNWEEIGRTETEIKYHCDGCNQDKTERIETVEPTQPEETQPEETVKPTEPEATEPEETTPSSSTTTTDPNKDNVPKTGDSVMIVVMTGLLVASVVGAAVCVLSLKKKSF